MQNYWYNFLVMNILHFCLLGWKFMFSFPMNALPIITKEYSIIRHSVWQAIDPNHIIVYIKEGKCIFEINNNKYLASPGDCIFIPKNTMYTRYPYKKALNPPNPFGQPHTNLVK